MNQRGMVRRRCGQRLNRKLVKWLNKAEWNFATSQVGAKLLSPGFEFQSCDALEFANVVGHQYQVRSQRLACDHYPSLSRSTRMRAAVSAVARSNGLNDHREEPFDFLSFLGWVLRFLYAAKQLIHCHLRNCAIGGCELAKSFHHPGTLTQDANTGVSIQKVSHAASASKRFDWRQCSLVRPGKCGIANVNFVKEANGPSARFEGFQHDSLTFLPDMYRRGR